MDSKKSNKPKRRFAGFTEDLHQRKLKKLKNIKKAYLEEMFVQEMEGFI